MDVVAAIWQTSVPLVLAAIAGMLAQRAGIWHLGLGGLISVAAMLSAVVGKETGSIAFGVLAALGGSVFFALIMWATIVVLKANPIIVGIGINMLGLGGTVLTVVAVYGAEGNVYTNVMLPRPLDFLPGLLGQMSLITWVTPLLVLFAWWLVCRTRFGLKMTAVGDYPFAARSAGISLHKMRLWALLLGGVFAGLAGVELAVGPLGAFTANMEAGRGLIAFAAVILGGAHPLATTLAAVFFGAVNYFGIWAQINMVGVVNPTIMLMLPYVVTVVAVVITAKLRGSKAQANLVEMKDG